MFLLFLKPDKANTASEGGLFVFSDSFMATVGSPASLEKKRGEGYPVGCNLQLHPY